MGGKKWNKGVKGVAKGKMIRAIKEKRRMRKLYRKRRRNREGGDVKWKGGVGEGKRWDMGKGKKVEIDGRVRG